MRSVGSSADIVDPQLPRERLVGPSEQRIGQQRLARVGADDGGARLPAALAVAASIGGKGIRRVADRAQLGGLSRLALELDAFEVGRVGAARAVEELGGRHLPAGPV